MSVFAKKDAVTPAQPTQMQEIWFRLRQNKVAMCALFVLAVIVLLAVCADFIADYGTDVLEQHPQLRLQSPSTDHWFGTDAFGRDLFARVIHGARYSLVFGLVCSTLAVVGGSLFGASAAYFGGKTEAIILRTMDAMMCIPSTLLTLTVVTAVGFGLRGMIIAMVFSNIPWYTRVVHSVVLSVVHQEYIQAALSVGAGHRTIIIQHVLPNAIGPIIVNAMMNVAGLIMGAAALSYIGMGIQPPAPEWGSMLQEATAWMRQHPHMVVFPGLAIVITSLSFNLLGDGLADALDPRRSEL